MIAARSEASAGSVGAATVTRSAVERVGGRGDGEAARGRRERRQQRRRQRSGERGQRGAALFVAWERDLREGSGRTSDSSSMRRAAASSHPLRNFSDLRDARRRSVIQRCHPPISDMSSCARWSSWREPATLTRGSSSTCAPTRSCSPSRAGGSAGDAALEDAVLETMTRALERIDRFHVARRRLRRVAVRDPAAGRAGAVPRRRARPAGRAPARAGGAGRRRAARGRRAARAARAAAAPSRASARATASCWSCASSRS